MDIWIRDGHADIFGDAHVGYSAILSDNAEVDADIRIRVAIPNKGQTDGQMDRISTCSTCSTCSKNIPLGFLV